MYRRIECIVIVLIVALIIGVSGCKSNTAEDAKDIALEYLIGKYEDEFTALGYQNENWAYDYKVITFKSDKYNSIFSVRLYEVNGKYYFEDDYYTISMKDDAENFFLGFIEEYDGEKFARVRIESYIKTDCDLFSEYINQEHYPIEVCFVYNDNWSEEIKQDILSKFIDSGCNEYVIFMHVYSIENFTEMPIDELLNGYKEGIISIDKYKIEEDFSVSELSKINYQ